MIQRVQSIYLLLAAIFSLVVAFFVPFFYGVKQEPLFLLNFPIFTGVFVLSGLISLFSIFRYRNRKQQVAAGRFNIIINFVLLGMLGYYFYESFEIYPANLGLGAFIPIIVVILVVLANKNIIKDEKLVRSTDRLR